MMAHGITMLEEENDHLRNTDVLKAEYDLEESVGIAGGG